MENERLPGTRVTADCAATPVPVNWDDCVPAVSVVVSVARRNPTAVGAKFTLIEHVAVLPVLTGSTAGSEQFGTVTKSPALGPEMLTVVKVNNKPPVLVRLIGLVPLVCPTEIVPKS